VSVKKPIALHSETDLRTHATTILRRVNAGARGGLLFLLNPVFALEEAGFELNATMRRHLLRGLRYGPKTKQRIRDLESEIERAAKRPINARSDNQVKQLLFTDLKLKPPKPVLSWVATAAKPAAGDAGEWDPDLEPGQLNPGVLEALRGAHPVVPKLIELRTILAGGWRFVDRQTFDRVKAGASVRLLRGVRFRSDSGKSFLSNLVEGER
jgi:hypothetical protein